MPFGLSTPMTKSISIADAESGRAMLTRGRTSRMEYFGLTMLRALATVLQLVRRVAAAREMHRAARIAPYFRVFFISGGSCNPRACLCYGLPVALQHHRPRTSGLCR